MAVYADTCILLSLFIRDSGTRAALDWLDKAGTRPVFASHWTVTEFISAVGIMARRGDISAQLHRESIAGFRRFCAGRLRLEAPVAADYERAAIWLENYPSGLRAGDALHLALCARLGTRLCTADATLVRAAEALGLPVEQPG